MDLRELTQKRLALHEQSKAIVERATREKRGLSDSEQREFDRQHADIMSIKAAIDRAAIAEAEERALGESRGRQTGTTLVQGTRATEAALALRAWALGARASSEMVEAAESLGVRHMVPELDMRALSSVTATQGQNAIPDEMMRAFWDAQKWYGRVEGVATVLRTSTGAPLPIPTTDDTSNTGEIVADSGPVTTTADPVFGQIILKPYKFSSKAVIVPIELLQDSSIDIPTFLGKKLGERIGRIKNTKFTTGTGTGEPNGAQVAAALGKTASATNAVTFDELIDLQHSVDVAYRDRPNTRFMVHDTVAAYLRKVKDSQNRYIWEMATTAGQPDRLLGAPVVINNDMDSAFSTNKRLVLYGDFSAYHIQNAGDVAVIRADELRVLNHQVVFLAFQRSDGNLADANAIRYLRTA